MCCTSKSKLLIIFSFIFLLAGCGGSSDNNTITNEAKTKLTRINFRDDNLKQCVLDTRLENIEDLKILDCSEKSIESTLGIEQLTALNILNLGDNELTDIDVSKNTTLVALFLNKNQLTNIDVSNNTSLAVLHLDNNQLISIDLTNNEKIKILTIDLDVICSGSVCP